jgi:6-phosphogluconolactonase
MKTPILLPTLIFLALTLSCKENHESMRLFVGKYNESGEKGIALFDLNQKDGNLNFISESDAGPNPASLCISKKRGLVYAANEVMNFNGGFGGGVTTLKYNDKKTNLERINDFSVPNGSPCFISLSPNENYLFLANYTGGSITVIKLDEQGIPVALTDTINYPSEGEKQSHAHMIAPGPAGKYVYLTDLGLGQIVIYTLDETSGKLKQVENGMVGLAKGSGPRHFAFSSDGKKMYVICELNSTIAVYGVNDSGLLVSLQVISTLKSDYKGNNSCADIHIGKNGHYLYGSNRGENTIVTFRIGSDGLLSLAGHTSCGGDWPRNFLIDPTGNYLLTGNQRSGNISVFRIDEKTGVPRETGEGFKLSSPVCLKVGF